MTKQKLNEIIERIIWIRDGYDLTMAEREALADACNVIADNIHALAEDGSNEAIEILQERNHNLLAEVVRLEETIKKIHFEVEYEADHYNALVNADIARGLYYALEIIDKHTKGEKR